MGLFSKSSSSTAQTNVTTVSDSRATGIENSAVATGGGSTTRVETIPVAPLSLVIDALQASDERRSAEARGLVEKSLSTSAGAQREAVAALATQRSAETETLTNSLKQLGPWILAAAVLWAWKGSK